MKQRLFYFLKYNKFAYSIYYYVFSFFINVMKLFVCTDDRLILFNSFAGRKFDDSPKAIYDAMKEDPRFKEYKLVWAFHQPDKYKDVDKIQTDGLLYFRKVLAARVWITNSSFERGLNFKGKNTLYFNTWHGTPLKKMGSDINSENTSFSSIAKNNFDVMMSQGRYETEIFSRSFNVSRKIFLEAGLPRNDILANYTEKERAKLRTQCGIESSQIVLLYCPTFREYEKDENHGVVMAPPMNVEKWSKELGEKYVLLIRAHYEVSKAMTIQDNSFVRNMTDYPNLNDLFIIADILISDYSSVFFDYSITGKAMIHFTYDYEKYVSKRGMYFDIRDYISGGRTEDEVITLIKKLEFEIEKKKTEVFRNKFVNFYGDATTAAIDCIAKEIIS